MRCPSGIIKLPAEASGSEERDQVPEQHPMVAAAARDLEKKILIFHFISVPLFQNSAIGAPHRGHFRA